MKLVEIGNTQTKVAVFNGDDVIDVQRFENANVEAVAKVLAIHPEKKTIVAASGDVSESLIAVLEQTGGYQLLTKGLDYGISMTYTTPHTLGIDRLANAAQALRNFKLQPVLVIDMGTCVTYDLVLNGCYQGGVIAPGLRMRSKAMAAFTSALPDVKLADTIELVGRSTIASLQSGTMNGWRAEIQALSADFTAAYENLQIVYTGGDLPHFEAGVKSRIFADPFWTLRGYMELYRRHAN
jgi:type III pantothenate kinase